jgi:hypothetical protein
MYRLARDKGFDPFKDAAVGTSDLGRFHLGWERDAIYISTNQGLKDVKTLWIFYRIKVEERSMDHLTTYRASSPSEQRDDLEGIELEMGQVLPHGRVLFQKDLIEGGYKGYLLVKRDAWSSVDKTQAP